MDEVRHFDRYGISFGAPEVDLATLKAHKEKVVGKLTAGLAAMAKMRKVTVLQGTAAFVDPFRLGVDSAQGGRQVVGFRQAIVAAGSEAVKLPFLQTPELKDDPRVVTSTGALELRQRPKRMLVIGGGIIGLEMGTVYSTLGARLDVVEMLDGLMQGADRDLVKVWQKMNAPRFDNILLKTKTVGAAGHEGRHPGALRAGRRYGGRIEGTGLRPGAAGRRPRAERPPYRRRPGRRHRERARLHPGRPADAHQRAAHLRDRRHRRPADARAQGDPRRPRGGRGRGRRAVRRRRPAPHGVRRARDPERGLHRPRGRLGRRHRGRREGARAEGQEGPVPLDRLGPRDRERPRRGLHQAAVRRGHARASSAAASSARTRAT